jgi:hypothetical protein
MSVVTPSLPEIFEEAFERAGGELRSGQDLRTIRRSLNILTLEWQNRGFNLWTVDGGTEAMISGTATYTMPADTIDLIEHSIRTGTGTSQLDTAIERISVDGYAKISNKNVAGRPTKLFIQRLATSVTVTMWPVPDSTSYSLAYYRLKGISGLSSGIGTSADIPPRFVPALIAGLAYSIAVKKPELSARAPLLKQEYNEQFELAASEDEERASFWFIPRIYAV